MVLFKPITGTGGALRYISWLSKAFDFPLYTLYSEYENPIDGWDEIKVCEFGGKRTLPVVGRRVGSDTLDRLEYTFWKPPKKYDVVISSGLPAKATMHYPHQTRIHLMHGFHKGAVGLPPRDTVSSNRFLALLQQLNRASLRSREKLGLERTDVLVANSKYTAEAIKCYFSESADKIIQPPVDVSSYYSSRSTARDFYLYLGLLSEYKRVDEIVKAFDGLSQRLIVAGSGPLEEQLREIGGDNVDIVGQVSEERKRELFSKCKGLIQHSLGETFGVTTVEALASGAPVIAVDDGNNPYLVDEGKTGLLYDQSGGLEALQNAVIRAENVDWDHEEIQSVAEQYSYMPCEHKWQEVLERI